MRVPYPNNPEAQSGVVYVLSEDSLSDNDPLYVKIGASSGGVSGAMSRKTEMQIGNPRILILEATIESPDVFFLEGWIHRQLREFVVRKGHGSRSREWFEMPDEWLFNLQSGYITVPVDGMLGRNWEPLD